MEKYFNNTNLINLLLKWRIHLIVILIAALVLAVTFSSPFFITPKFKSIAVIYPANVSPYSEESETEQMFQILQSQDIMDSVIIKFNLSEHYKIAKDYKYFKININIFLQIKNYLHLKFFKIPLLLFFLIIVKNIDKFHYLVEWLEEKNQIIK